MFNTLITPHQVCLRIVYLVILTIGISSSMKASIDYEFNLTESVLKFDTVQSPNGQKYLKISGNDFWNDGEAGEPEIPYTNIRFLVPDNATDFSVQITDTDKITSTHPDIRLYPIQKEFSINDYTSDMFTEPDENAYETYSSHFKVQVMEDSWLEGKYHVVTLAIKPVSYESVSNTLSVCRKMSIKLDFSENTILGLKKKSNDTVGYININDIVVNPESNNKDMKSSLEPVFGEKSPGRYYIISERSLLPALLDLATWKTQKGYIVTLKSIEDIYEDPRYEINQDTGIMDNAASLRRYLQDEKDEYGGFFCLLVGDHKTSMPIRKVRNYYSNNSNGDNYLPTDNYFSDLSKDDWELVWDKNGLYVCDTYKTEFSPDIYVGRLLCHTREQISNYTSKLLLYESNPGRGNSDYLDHATVTVQFDGANDYDNDGQPEYKKILDRMKSTFTSVDSLMDCRIFDDNAFGSPSGKEMLAKLNESGYASLIGHGEPSTIACSGKREESYIWEYVKALNSYSYNEDPILRQTNITHDCDDNGLDLLNNINSPSIIYTFSCTTCPFDIYNSGSVIFDLPHTMASSYTVGGLYGGVAYLGNTREGYFTYSSVLEGKFLDNVKYNRKIGVAEALSKYLYTNNKHVRHTHNLIGDPEFEMWLHKPYKLDVDLLWQNGYISLNKSDQFEGVVITNDGAGNIRICNYKKSPYINLPYFNDHDKMVSVGIFKTNYLPIVKLDCYNQHLSNCKKRFVVRDATFGTGNENASNVTIGEEAYVSVRTIDKAECGKFLKISDGGNLEIFSDKSVNIMGSTIETGGNMNVTGERVLISNGFSVEFGGSVTINKR